MGRSSGIIITIVVFFMLFSTIACNKNRSSLSEDGLKRDKDMDNVLQKELANPNIKLLLINDDEAILETNKAFEEKYKGKVDIINKTFNQQLEYLIASMNADDSPDVVSVNQDRILLYPTKGLLKPIDNYFSQQEDIWNTYVMEQFKYKGQYYGICRSVNIMFIYFNKNLFENYGIKTPLEYYKEGNWSWETFKEVAVRLTVDTDKDGAIDQWGYTAQQPDLFVRANGRTLVQVKPDGNVECMLKDPAVIEALQFIQDIYNKYKIINTKANAWQTEFKEGKAAMFADGKGKALSLLEGIKYEWDIVPFPTGPQGEKAVSPGTIFYWAIPSGSKNAEGAATWIRINAEVGQSRGGENLAETFTTTQLELIRELEKNVKIECFNGLVTKKKDPFWRDIKAGKPISTIVETYIPSFESEISLSLTEN